MPAAESIMKIAVSGTHCTGKTTLVEELARALPTYATVGEPYYLLQEEGHQFAELPCLEDFELQLDRSIECVLDSGRDSLLERCPVDFLAYLHAHRAGQGFDVATWLPRVRGALERLDLIVFVPIEHPDRILVPHSENTKLRKRVDEQLRKLLLENPWELEVGILEVTGTSGERARRVLVHIDSMRA